MLPVGRSGSATSGFTLFHMGDCQVYTFLIIQRKIGFSRIENYDFPR